MTAYIQVPILFMTNDPKPCSDSNLEKEKDAPSNLTDGNAAAPSDNEKQQDLNHSRKSARSKREIMEELSRTRFPWDE